ncbi:S-adenosyl-L-homocysteine hydrolase [uncultured Tateyamaria sp.]|uniref:S-adenosyl-L-homocysteine hydrolase n=1 Tax=uncultured Tateyamaria sp. TaxID=455651 RepID=UPI002629EF08|nr:S-adenosyl-L-homocysteine hydrolase [uncultured Tateyamaria sp.]
MKPAIWIAATLTLSATSLAAQDVCMSAPEMEASLVDWYGETPVEESRTESTAIWASEETGTWTLVQYLADGQSCVLAQGHDWGSEVSEDLLVAGLDTGR